MLALSRKVRERLFVKFPRHPELNFSILVIEVRGGEKVRLGFEAPPEVVFEREEIAGIAKEDGKPFEIKGQPLGSMILPPLPHGGRLEISDPTQGTFKVIPHDAPNKEGS